jgi:hypothetical protein
VSIEDIGVGVGVIVGVGVGVGVIVGVGVGVTTGAIMIGALSVGTKLGSLVITILSNLLPASRPANLIECCPEERENTLGIELLVFVIASLPILPVTLVHCQFGDQVFSAVSQISTCPPSIDT